MLYLCVCFNVCIHIFLCIFTHIHVHIHTYTYILSEGLEMPKSPNPFEIPKSPHTYTWRDGGLGSSTIFKKFNEPYAPS